MFKAVGKLKALFIMLLAVVMLSSGFSMVFAAKAAPKAAKAAPKNEKNEKCHPR